jgi:hypothetical protein
VNLWTRKKLVAIVVLVATVGVSCGGATTNGGGVPDSGVGVADGPTDDSTPDTGESDGATDSNPEDSPTLDAIVEGGSGGALHFSGSAEVTLPSASGGASETAFSSELWFRTTMATGMLFEVYSSNPIGADRSTYLKGGRVCFYVYAPDYSDESGTTAIALDSTPAMNDGTLVGFSFNASPWFAPGAF